MRYFILTTLIICISCSEVDKSKLIEAEFKVDPILLAEKAYSDNSGFQINIPRNWDEVLDSLSTPFYMSGLDAYFYNSSDSSILMINSDSIPLDFTGDIQSTKFILGDCIIHQSVFQNELFLIFNLKVTPAPEKYLYFVLHKKDLENKIRQVESSIGSIKKTIIN